MLLSVRPAKNSFPYSAGNHFVRLMIHAFEPSFRRGDMLFVPDISLIMRSINMYSHARIHLICLACLILLNLCPALFAQNQPPTQNNQLPESGEIRIPAPTAVPLLTQEEAEFANKEAGLVFEEYMHEKELEFNKSIAQRNKHEFYRNIIYLIFVLIHLSFIGYSNYFRRMLRIHWTNVFMFEACALALLMLISGMIHFMKQCAYILESVGLLLVFAQMFKKGGRWRIPSWKETQQMLFRYEYSWLFFITLIPFIGLISFKTELGSAPDHWNAWYRQFFYLVSNNRWADAGYDNYASAYAMIVNGVSYYYALLFNNSSTQILYYGYYWLTIMMLMPLFRYVKWNNLPFYEILFFTFCLVCYRTVSEKRLGDYLLLGISIFIVIMHIAFSEKRKEFLSNSIMYIMAIFLVLILFSMPVPILFYIPDTTLGCATVGVFFCIAWGVLYHHDIIKWRIWFYVLPLAVLSLIKPTGVIPALLLSLFFVLCIIGYSFKKYRSYLQKKRIGLIIFCSVTLISIAFSPLITNGLWNMYVKHNNLNYQHTVSPAQLLSKATDQIKNGISSEEENNWKRRISRMSYFGNSKGKSWIETKMDKFFFSLSKKHPLLNSDQTLSNYPLKYSHVLVVSALLILYSFLVFCLVKKKVICLCLLVFVSLTYLVFVFNQYYITPMFTPIPGAFRYFYPAFALVLGVSFLGGMIPYIEKKNTLGLVCSILLLFCLGNKTIVTIEHSKGFDVTHSSVGYAVLAGLNSSSDTNLKTFYGPDTRETQIFEYLIGRNILNKGRYSNILKTVPDIIDSPFLVLVGPSFIFSQNKSIPRFIVPDSQNSFIQRPGIYIAYPQMVIKDDSSHESPSKIQLVEFFANNDAISLLNSVYYFSDLSSWTLPPWVEIKSFSLDRNVWLIPPLYQNVVQEGHNMITISANDARLTMWDTIPKFCFARDSIRLTGKCTKGMNFSLYLGLFKKEKGDSDQKVSWIKHFPMNITTSDFSKDEIEFKADFNLADIPTNELNLYYKIGIELEPGTKGTIRDFHLYQYVSGKLNINQGLAKMQPPAQTENKKSKEQ